MNIGQKSGLKLGKATRDAFGRALESLGEKYPKVVTVDGDVGNSTRTEWFAKKYPERSFNVGIAESNLVSVAGGLASTGKTPVVASFACFLMCNAFDQIRMSVAFPGLNVKLVGTHSGISIGEDGPSQMGIEDVSLACSLAGMTVIVPCDEPSAIKATEAMLDHDGPVYMRLGRADVPVVYTDGCDFQIGKANTIRDGGDVTIITNGLTVGIALDAAAELAEQGVSARVLDMHTVKPLDEAAVAAAAKETGCIVVLEEHMPHGGLGAVISAAVTATHPVPVECVNSGDRYAESGDPQGLLDKYGLTPAAVVAAANKVRQRAGK